MSTTITYKGETLATLQNELRTMLTEGKIMESDVEIEDTADPPVTQSKTRTYTPTTSQQTETVEPDEGYDGLSQVGITVDAIPPAYIIPSGTKSITANGTSIDVAQYALADVAVPMKMGVLRPDAEKVKTYTYDKYAVATLGLTLPAYSTTAQTLVASAALGETYTMDYNNYKYYILERMLTIPIYDYATRGKGRCEYHLNSQLYEVSEIPANTLGSINTSTGDTTREVLVTSRSVSVVNAGAFYRLCYWSSGAAFAAYATAAYGTYQAVVAPTVASGVITVNSPTCGMRGSATYFSSTYWGHVTDVRIQYVIDIYRAPKGSLSVDGWGDGSQMNHIIDCLHSSSRTLT